MKRFLLLLIFLQFLNACNADKNAIMSDLNWTWISDYKIEPASKRLIYEEYFGGGNSLRLNQSMAIVEEKVFCFNDGKECRVFDLNTMQSYSSDELPDYSHHNNAQFLNKYYKKGDKYPLLLLSKGDYPPKQNECYIVRIIEDEKGLSFETVKTIYNTLKEARNNGSWVADSENNLLYLYCMTKSDWRVKEENYFCIFSFELPNIEEGEEVTLTEKDVKSYWEYPYLIHQGGTSYRGYLFFNVQSLPIINGYNTERNKNVLAINEKTGKVVAVMPLTESLETEGICVYDNHIYLSFKDGNEQQEPNNTVFKIIRYSLPMAIVNDL